MAVVSVDTWRPLPGRLPEVLSNLSELTKIQERLGARVRVLQAGAGPRPGTIAVVSEFDDMLKYGEFVVKGTADQESQAFLAKVYADAPAEIVESGLASDLTLP